MSQDITNSAWFEEENDLIKSCGALQSALGLSKSFSTSDIADVCANADPADSWLVDNEDIRMPHSASELAINKLRINSDVLLMATTMQGRLGNASRSLSTCVVVGDMASTSQLPSPNRYSSSLQNNCASSSLAFSPTDLVRSVNKKVSSYWWCLSAVDVVVSDTLRRSYILYLFSPGITATYYYKCLSK